MLYSPMVQVAHVGCVYVAGRPAGGVRGRGPTGGAAAGTKAGARRDPRGKAHEPEQPEDAVPAEVLEAMMQELLAAGG
jgi:hypothetical protein